MLNLKEEVGVKSRSMDASLQLSTFEISLKMYRSFTNHIRLTSRDVHTGTYHYHTFYDLHFSLGGQIVKHFIITDIYICI